MLVIASTDLQKEIVEGGRVSHTVLALNPKVAACFVFLRSEWAALFHSEISAKCAGVFLVKGAATIREFYAKNSRWTEGLISAAKAVGWGATEMV